LLKQDSIVDDSNSTKNNDQQRELEMDQTKTGKEWDISMKAHIGTDVQSGSVHTVIGNTAKDSDKFHTGWLAVFALSSLYMMRYTLAT
jgi:IS5 family transposase